MRNYQPENRIYKRQQTVKYWGFHLSKKKETFELDQHVIFKPPNVSTVKSNIRYNATSTSNDSVTIRANNKLFSREIVKCYSALIDFRTREFFFEQHPYFPNVLPLDQSFF